MATCARCNEDKPDSAFHMRLLPADRPAWVPLWCRACCTAYQRERHASKQEAAEARAAAHMEVPVRHVFYRSEAARQQAWSEQQERHHLNDVMHVIEEAIAVLDPDAEWIGLLEWDAYAVRTL